MCSEVFFRADHLFRKGHALFFTALHLFFRFFCLPSGRREGDEERGGPWDGVCLSISGSFTLKKLECLKQAFIAFEYISME